MPEVPSFVVMLERDAAMAAAARDPGRVYLSLDRRSASRGFVTVSFGHKLFRLVFCLACGNELTSTEVYHAIYGDEPDGGPINDTQAVSLKINHARSRLAELGLGVRNRWGFGYSMSALP